MHVNVGWLSPQHCLMSNVSSAAGPIGLPAYVVGLPCAVGAVAAILLVVIIIACVCYYHKNKVVVISVSSTYTQCCVVCSRIA